MPELTLQQCLVMLAAGSSHAIPLFRLTALVESLLFVMIYSPGLPLH